MNKRQILSKLKIDLESGEMLHKIIEDYDTKLRLGAQNMYIRNLIEWITQEGKV